MKLFAVTFALILTAGAHAKAVTVNCIFGALNTQVQVIENSATVVVDQPEGRFIYSGAAFQRQGTLTQVNYGDTDGDSILQYNYDGRGRDGVSDRVYSYSARAVFAGDPTVQYGGCY